MLKPLHTVLDRRLRWWMKEEMLRYLRVIEAMYLVAIHWIALNSATDTNKILMWAKIAVNPANLPSTP